MVAGEPPRPVTDRDIDRTLRTGGGRHARCPTRGTPTTRPASGCCRARAPARTCAGSRSTPATSSTPSTPTRTAPTSSSTWSATTGCSRPTSPDPTRGPAYLTRFTVDTVAGKVREHRFDEHSQEFPRYDERLTGQRHRFGYSVGVVAEGVTTGDAVLKHDVVAGTTAERRLGAGQQASEFCFVPGADDAAEDAGVLMGYVFDPATDRSDLVLLDAETLEDVAAVHLPARVPAGFHGNWAPTA